MGWLEYFEIFIGAGDAHEDKPSDAPLKLAIEESGIKAEKQDIWFIGDTENDMLCAKTFGCHSVLVIEGAEQHHLAKALNPTIAVENCGTLQKILFQIFS